MKLILSNYETILFIICSNLVTITLYLLLVIIKQLVQNNNNLIQNLDG